MSDKAKTVAETVLAHTGDLWVVSAERSALSPDENSRRHRSMVALAQALLAGTEALEASGVWEGGSERSLVLLVRRADITGRSRAEAFAIAVLEAFGQDSVLFRPEMVGPATLLPQGTSLTEGRILTPGEPLPGACTIFADGSRVVF